MKSITTAALGLALFGASPAQAGHWKDATITVDNQFDGKADVFINGNYRGTLRGDQRMTFETNPGHRTVTVTRPNGAVLASSTLHLGWGSEAMVKVRAPMGTLFVRNTSPMPLLVTADDSAVWITPNSGMNLKVTTGKVDLVAQISDRRGTVVVEQRSVWVEPGKAGSATIDYRPAPTGFAVTNRNDEAIRLLVGGKDIGLIRPGGERFIASAPGSVRLIATELRGGVLYAGSIDVRRGATSNIVVREDDHRHASGGPPSSCSSAHRDLARL